MRFLAHHCSLEVHQQIFNDARSRRLQVTAKKKQKHQRKPVEVAQPGVLGVLIGSTVWKSHPPSHLHLCPPNTPFETVLSEPHQSTGPVPKMLVKMSFYKPLVLNFLVKTGASVSWRPFHEGPECGCCSPDEHWTTTQILEAFCSQSQVLTCSSNTPKSHSLIYSSIFQTFCWPQLLQKTTSYCCLLLIFSGFVGINGLDFQSSRQLLRGTQGCWLVEHLGESHLEGQTSYNTPVLPRISKSFPLCFLEVILSSTK